MRQFLGNPLLSSLSLHSHSPPSSRFHFLPAQVSTIKYTLVKQIIQLGYDTLITDMDLVYLKNPFHHLHRS